MQDFIQDIVIAFIVLVISLYIGKKLYSAYRSGKYFCFERCTTCKERVTSACCSQSEQERERKK